MKPIFDRTIHEILNDRLDKLEKHLQADVIFFYGPIGDYIEKPFRDFIEQLKEDNDQKRLCIFLNTPGGSAETVEKMVNIIRHHYNEIYFIVPDAAYSAGTIFCMAGDKIFMDYSSSLGPIDPQVYNGKNWVPALGYLDKVNQLIKKSLDSTISPAEMMLLRDQDLAMLRSFEQARDLTIALLEKWLVEFKFKDWLIHETDINKKGQKVSLDDKKERAKKIAKDLSDNSLWHSHGRSIGIKELTQILRLKIEDYSTNEETRKYIRDYNDLICQYIVRNNAEVFLHSRKFI
jgi:hypothetical protein